jgi:exodeoxyribonuclease III
MNLITWNVNGIRAVCKKGFLEWLALEKPDILCVQETKADTTVMQQWWSDISKVGSDNSDLELFESGGNTNILSQYEIVWHSCSLRKGYSGTAIFYKKGLFENAVAKTGLGVSKFDDEGRTTILETDKFVLINSYYPQGGREGRIPYKVEFYEEIIKLTAKYQKAGQNVILCGDLNTTVADIDLSRPKENRKTTGCLPVEREVLDRLLQLDLVDSFRYFYPESVDKYTYWDQITRARDRNVGWRIDYFLFPKSILTSLKSCQHLEKVFGSDHCPVKIEVDV